MTTKTFPLELWQRMRREWLGETYYEELMAKGEEHDQVVATPDNRPPDRDGGYQVDPDENTKQWEWDIELSPTEELIFEDVLKSVRSGLGTSYQAVSTDIDYLRTTMLDTEAPEFDRRVARVMLSMLRDEG